VIHDDIDLVFGRLKIKEKGGDGGHRGVRSIIDAFGGGDFTRLRIGVGRPDAERGASDYVLGKFSLEERKVLSQIITTAKDAIVTILCKGTKEGMNRFNDKRIVILS
jgi:PTH1 family peptidyl-tRNA hydrolase